MSHSSVDLLKAKDSRRHSETLRRANGSDRDLCFLEDIVLRSGNLIISVYLSGCLPICPFALPLVYLPVSLSASLFVSLLGSDNDVCFLDGCEQ